MAKSMIEEFCEDRDSARLLEQEEAIMDVTELICEIMEDQGVSRSELAERLGTSKSNVTQTLDGTRNMTVRKISDMLFELGHSLKVDVREPGRIRSRKKMRVHWGDECVPRENRTWVSQTTHTQHYGQQKLGGITQMISSPKGTHRIAG
ncbi:MAG: helix-turn-helix domain-containing protein [Planctomycetota bacterium]